MKINLLNYLNRFLCCFTLNFVLFIVTPALAQDGGRNQANDNPVNVSATAVCPFLTNSANAQRLVEQTRTHLQNLRSEEAERCGPMNAQINRISNAFANLQTTVANDAIAVDPSVIGCSNYENRLLEEYNLAVAIHERQETTFLNNTFYTNCQNDSDVPACLRREHESAFGRMTRRCSLQNQQSLNVETRNNLDIITTSLEQLIRTEGEGCNAVARQNIFQVALQQGTAALALAQGAGLPGLGISIAGRLLSAIGGILFQNNDSVDNLMSAIDAENNRPHIQCLYFNLQQTVLGCESGSKNQPAEPSEPPANSTNQICEATVSNLDALNNFAVDIRRNLRLPENNQTPTREMQETNARAFSGFHQLIYDGNSPRALFEGGPSVLSMYQEMATALSQSNLATDQMQGEALNRVLQQFQTIQNNRTMPNRSAAIQDLSLQLAGLAGDPPLNLPEMINRYKASRSSQDQNFAAALNASRMQQTALGASALAAQAQAQSQNEQERQRLATSLYALVNTGATRRHFVDRLEQLERDWARVSASTDPDSKMPILNEMYGLCVSTQGMAYFHNDPRSRSTVTSFSNATPRRDAQAYNSVCSKFVCQPPAEQLFTPFDPNDSRYGSGTVSDRFKRYQCALSRSHAAGLNRLRQNIRSNSSPSLTPIPNQICGP